MLGLKVIISSLNEDTENHLEFVITEYLELLHNEEESPLKNVIEKLVSNFLEMDV